MALYLIVYLCAWQIQNYCTVCKFNNWPQNYCRKLVEGSLEAEFDSAHNGKKYLENYNFQGLGPNFQVSANMQKFGMPGHFVHNFAQNYCMKMVEGPFKMDFYSSHDGEKKNSENYNFRGRGS